MLSDALGHLKHFPRFILYRTAPRAGTEKLDKIPLDFTGATASAQDASNWLSYDHAAAIKSTIFPSDEYGIGFVLTPDTKVFCLDVDSALTPNGQWHPIASRLCAMLVGGAVEVSVSGKGLHLWASYTGDLPAHSKRATVEGINCELYTSGRFIALGNQSTALGNAGTDCTAGLQQLIVAYFSQTAGDDGASRVEWAEGHQLGWTLPEDAELIERALRFTPSASSVFGNKATFADLWTRNVPALSKAFPDANGREFDESQADMALAAKLAWLTGNDCPRIERLLRRSALARDKWDSHRTYLSEFTIPRALRTDGDFYNPNYKEEKRREQAAAPCAAALTVPSGTPDELNPEDFWAYLPTHNYINRRTRTACTVDAVNGHLKQFTDHLGMKPTQWLDRFRAVHQMSWQPGHPEIIEGVVEDKGHLRPDPKGRIYNLYRPSEAVASEADPSLWVNHVRLLYPDDADHLMKWFAWRIQNPGDKINHALVIGGVQGIGKDLMLEPLRYGVGKHNLADVNPGDLFKDFTTWVESTLVIINEARDLGDVDRYKFYESCKRFIAAPPDTLPCNKKYLASYDVPNVMGVIFTSNHKISGLYIDPDDRRHYVAWSSAEKQPAAYFDRLWTWMHDEGGKQAVLGFLQRLNIEEWNAKEPPPKTEAWHQIVAANANPEEATLSDALEGIQIATVREIINTVQFRGHLDLATALMDKRTSRRIPHLLERAGFEALPNPHAKSDGRWVIDGKRETLYADRKLSNAERLTLAAKKSIPPPPVVMM